ncbi:MAG: VOC family protein [Acidobacteria bacterium]|nr:VOC family protein [Acidobacteriota bacterium]
MPTDITRRAFVQLAACGLASFHLHGSQPAMTATAAVDHLLLGVPDLETGIGWVEQRTGVRAVVGGVHPGRGTRNALIALAGRHYLEILAPDPAQEGGGRADLLALREPRLITWAAVATDIGSLATRVRAAGLSAPGPRPGSRARPDGRLLEWTTIGIESAFASGGIDPLPFFIQWAPGSPHPSQDSPRGCALTSLEFEHPDADRLRDTLSRLGIDAATREGKAVRIAAALTAPKGRLVLT